ERARQGYLRLAGGHPTARDADRAAMRLFDNTGRVMLEFAVLDRLLPAGRIAIAGAEHFVGARAGDRPVLVMALHLGNWEVSAPLFGRELRGRANILTIIRLAWASGATVIPAYAERLAGARFRVTYLPAVDLAPAGDDAAAAVRDNVERLDRVITPLVLARLD